LDLNFFIYVLLDNDQGERLILAVVVDAPDTNIRKVEIRSVCDNEKIVLYLQRGDGYAMDGKMQKHYTHGVPEVKETSKDTGETEKSESESDRRISVIFRYGRKVTYIKDSGKPCMSLDPAFLYGVVKKPWFGGLRGLYEGYLYSRQDLWEMGAHTSQQRGVSGNMTYGCDCISVAGKGEVKGEDSLLELTYSSSKGGKGAEGMIVSCEKGFLVRVFRTDTYRHVNQAVVPANAFYKRISGAYYRYDGLYKIQKFERSNPKKREEDKKEEYVFQLLRCGRPHNVYVGDEYRILCKGIGTIA
jgi:SAD/SRA domain